MAKRGVFNLFSKEQPATTQSYLVAAPKSLPLKELKGEVQQQSDIRFAKELGEPHPFDFEVTEGLYKTMGMVAGIVDKYCDFVWGPGFFTISEDERAKEIVDQWLKDVNFDSKGRQWLKEALIKGSGFMELGGTLEQIPQGCKVLDSTTMYVDRDKKGVINGFNQFLGNNKRVQVTKQNMINFKPFQIADLYLNRTAGDAYGQGIIWPNRVGIDLLLQNTKDIHQLVHRKAGAPIVAKVKPGDDPDTQISDADVQALADKLTFLTNKTEWALGPNVELEALQFGNLGENFETVLKLDMEMLIFGFQVPEVLMGKGSIPEGLAKVQMDAFERRIQSIQVELEKVIEEKIFRRILLANGMDAHVEFQWGEPSNDEKNQKIQQITTLLSNAFLNPKLRALLDGELAELLGFKAEQVEMDDEERRREEEENQQPIVPGQNGDTASLPIGILHYD
jgi:hypothetical protein